MIRVLTERLADRAVVVDVGTATLVLSGTVARVGDDRVTLTDTEARVLAVLAERRGTVVTKPELLRRVWGDVTADPHLVEVTIGRVRRRLGPTGTAIRVIPRRGYILDTVRTESR
jgi:DNA-binding winged helix-turn-helix (wHTH) protein